MDKYPPTETLAEYDMRMAYERFYSDMAWLIIKRAVDNLDAQMQAEQEIKEWEHQKQE